MLSSPFRCHLFFLLNFSQIEISRFHVAFLQIEIKASKLSKDSQSAEFHLQFAELVFRAAISITERNGIDFFPQVEFSKVPGLAG